MRLIDDSLRRLEAAQYVDAQASSFSSVVGILTKVTSDEELTENNIAAFVRLCPATREMIIKIVSALSK